MLSIKPLTGGGGDIYAYLAQGDYYSERDRVTGRWFGKGAAALGLSGDVKLEDFENIREGNDPKTGKFIRVRKGKNNMYDCTLSAPKSVSLLARPGGDRRLDRAHEIAVTEALAQMERETVCKVQKNKKYSERKTGSLIAAVYTHDTSRELDPQLHSHCVLANMTFDASEERWKALHAGAIFARKAYLQEVYRNVLAREVMKLGYKIEDVWNDRHTDRSFEIVGIDKSLRRKFSKMSGRIAKAVEQFIEQYRTRPTDREVGQLARTKEVRPDKMYEVSGEEVAARQLAQMTEPEKAQIIATREKALANDGREPEPWDVAVSVQFALDHLFQRVSVAKDFEIARLALIHGRGKVSVEAIESHLAELKQRDAILRHKNDIATQQSVDREKQMIGIINRGIGKHDRLDRGNLFAHGEKLSDHQKEAVDFILGSRDFAVNMQGAPGTGKTWTLQEVYRRLKEAGREVVAIAPTRSAKEELEKVGIANPITLEQLLQDKLAGARVRNRVVMLDEAGMVSCRQMAELLRLGYAHNARFIFSGDTKQIQPVEAGDALLTLENESSLRRYALTQIERQKNPEYAAAIEAMRDDPLKGFDLLDAMGAIQEIPRFDRPGLVAEAVKGKRDALVVAATHDEIDRINHAVQLAGESEGERESRTFTRMVPLNWTDAEKREIKNFEPGMVLIFHRQTKEGKVGQAYEVVATDGRFVRTHDLRGVEVAFSRRQMASAGVFTRSEIQAAVGDKIIFLANRKDKAFECVNGGQAVIESFDKQGRAVLNTGQTMPIDFFQFDLGHAITSHKSQGKTVDEVIVSADRMSRELFYVSTSRGRHGITIFTGNKEMLREHIAISGARPSALELERLSTREFLRDRNHPSPAPLEVEPVGLGQERRSSWDAQRNNSPAYAPRNNHGIAQPERDWSL